MAAKFKRGDRVVQIVPAPLKGRVADFSIDREQGHIQVLVQWEDADQRAHERWFKEDEIRLQG